MTIQINNYQYFKTKISQFLYNSAITYKNFKKIQEEESVSLDT